jgi:hypothetical protein
MRWVGPPPLFVDMPFDANKICAFAMMRTLPLALSRSGAVRSKMERLSSQQCTSAKRASERFRAVACSAAVLMGMFFVVTAVHAGEGDFLSSGASGGQGAQIVHLQRKAERGSQTVSMKATAALSYDNAAPLSRKSGSGQGAGIDAKAGFRCANGKHWAIIRGEIQCGETLTLSGGAANVLAGGKVLYMQANLINGFRTGRVLRITGTAMDVRIDMFGLNGILTGSCYLTQDVNTCHLGSPNTANPGLAELPQFPTSGGQPRYASELVGGNLVFAGNLTGGALQDAYIASVVKNNTTLTVYFAGIHYLDGSQGNQLRPVYSFGQIQWDDLSGMFGNRSEMTLATMSAWSANTP